MLAAHSLMIPVRGGDKDEASSPRLPCSKACWKTHPDDTGAIHYFIHGTEFDGRAEDAIAYAERLGKLALGCKPPRSHAGPHAASRRPL